MWGYLQVARNIFVFSLIEYIFAVLPLILVFRMGFGLPVMLFRGSPLRVLAFPAYFRRSRSVFRGYPQRVTVGHRSVF